MGLGGYSNKKERKGTTNAEKPYDCDWCHGELDTETHSALGEVSYWDVLRCYSTFFELSARMIDILAGNERHLSCIIYSADKPLSLTQIP